MAGTFAIWISRSKSTEYARSARFSSAMCSSTICRSVFSRGIRVRLMTIPSSPPEAVFVSSTFTVLSMNSASGS
jgi:hypothetical protein